MGVKQRRKRQVCQCLCTKRQLHQVPAAAATAKSPQSCRTLCDPRDGSPPGSPVPGILQARTRVGCHFLLQCMKVKSESEVAQSCPTPSNPVDCSLPGSSVHGVCQARVLEWIAIAFSNHSVWCGLKIMQGTYLCSCVSNMHILLRARTLSIMLR